jgi:hypothetical protein
VHQPRAIIHPALIVLFLLAGCNFPGIKSPSRKHDPGRERTSAAEAVAALQETDSATDGIWSILANLGIGVYTPDGSQVMPGSETAESDFWLYDFEVDALAHMAGQPARPFREYYDLLASLGYQGTQEDLLSAYRDTYARHQDAFLVGLFREMDLQFAAGASLTPFQEWLLLLDTFVPPNGGAITIGSPPDTGVRLGKLASSTRSQGAPCGQIVGGGIQPFWGLMQSESDIDAAIQAIEVYYAIHGPMIASAVTSDLSSSTESGHEGHGQEGDRMEYRVHADVDFVPWAEVPVGATSCGAFVDFQWRPMVGPMDSVPVTWRIPDALADHGPIQQQDPITDRGGDAKLVVQLQHEEAEGIGPYKEENGSVEADLDLRTAFMAAGIYDARLLDFVPPRAQLGPVPVTVSWHATCDQFTIMFSETLHQEVKDYSSDIRIEGPILVHIHPGADPASLEGSETIPVSGEGHAGDCSFKISGSDKVDISGTASPGAGKEDPMLHITVNHNLQISMQGDKCGGGTRMPIPLGGGQLEMPLRDGETQGGPFSQPTVSGVTLYTLQVYCGY